MKAVEPGENPLAPRIRALAERAIAEGARTFTALWEDRDGALTVDSAPDSACLRLGMGQALVAHTMGNGE